MSALNDDRGVSIMHTPGEFRTDTYYSPITRSVRVQWDYRDAQGTLHSGVARSTEDAEKAAAQYGYARQEARA